MAVVGGGWRKSRFLRWVPLFLRYFYLLQSLHTNASTQNPDGKITIKTVASNTSSIPKKWRWLAVVGGNRVFSAFLKLLKSAVPHCGISVGILFRCSGCSKGHPEPRPQGSLNPNLGTADITSCCRLFLASAYRKDSLMIKTKIPTCLPGCKNQCISV